MYGPVAGRRSDGRSDPAGSQRRASWFHDCIRGGPGDSASCCSSCAVPAGPPDPAGSEIKAFKRGRPAAKGRMMLPVLC